MARRVGGLHLLVLSVVPPIRVRGGTHGGGGDLSGFWGFIIGVLFALAWVYIAEWRGRRNLKKWFGDTLRQIRNQPTTKDDF